MKNLIIGIVIGVAITGGGLVFAKEVSLDKPASATVISAVEWDSPIRVALSSKDGTPLDIATSYLEGSTRRYIKIEGGGLSGYTACNVYEKVETKVKANKGTLQ